MALQWVEEYGEEELQGVLALFRQVDWARERRPEDVRRMLASGSILFALRDAESGKLVAFARAMTDGVYHAMIHDVIVDEVWRHQGLGRMLMERMLQHPGIAHMAALHLNTGSDRLAFYEKWGFSADLEDVWYMRRYNKPDQGGGSP